MATKLDKKLLRESSVIIDGREIMVSLTPSQEISLKLKGMKSGSVSINIEELWYQLNDTDSNEGSSSGISINTSKPSKSSKNNPMISLNDLRTYNAISALDYPTLVKFEEIIRNLMDNYSEKYGKYSKNEKLR